MNNSRLPLGVVIRCTYRGCNKVTAIRDLELRPGLGLYYSFGCCRYCKDPRGKVRYEGNEPLPVLVENADAEIVEASADPE